MVCEEIFLLMIVINETVRRETIYICIWTFIFSVLMQAVFLLLGKWALSVLFGNVLSASLSILNFFLMALTVHLPGGTRTLGLLLLSGSALLMVGSRFKVLPA